MPEKCIVVAWSTAFYRHTLQFHHNDAILNLGEVIASLVKGGYVVTVTEGIFNAPAKQRFKL